MTPPPRDDPPGAAARGGQKAAMLALLPHLWPKGDPDLKLRVVLALVCLFLGKLANIYVPIFFKGLVDALGPKAGTAITLPLSC